MKRRSGRYALVGILILGLSLISLFGGATSVAKTLYESASQDDYMIEISPASRRMSFKPGETKKENFQIKNVGRRAVTIEIYATAYSAEDGATDLNEELAENYTKVSEWITFKGDNGKYYRRLSLTLEPNHIGEVRYAVSAPSDATGGGQYAIIFAEFMPSGTTNEDKTFVARSRAGMALYTYVNDAGIVRDAEVTNISVQNVVINGKIAVDYDVKNKGNIDFQASTEMTVSSLFGKEIYKNNFIETVLPENSKSIHNEWEETSGFGVFRVKYRITAVNFVSEDERIILVMPTGVVMVLALIIVVVVIMIRYLQLKTARARRAKMMAN